MQTDQSDKGLNNRVTVFWGKQAARSKIPSPKNRSEQVYFSGKIREAGKVKRPECPPKDSNFYHRVSSGKMVLSLPPVHIKRIH